MPTINNLPTLTTATGEMVFPIVDNTGATTVTKKATLATFQQFVIGTAPIGYTGSQGDLGGTGYIGSQGYTGSIGYAGSVGSTGYVGSIGMFSRTITTGTVVSLASSATANISLTGFTSYALLKITVSTASWVTVYASTATRASDAGRPIITDPTPNSGVIAEIISTGSSSLYFTPAVIGFSIENPQSTSIPIKVYNNGVNTSTIAVTLSLVKLEG